MHVRWEKNASELIWVIGQSRVYPFPHVSGLVIGPQKQGHRLHVTVSVWKDARTSEGRVCFLWEGFPSCKF